jgi:hypothetical protein
VLLLRCVDSLTTTVLPHSVVVVSGLRCDYRGPGSGDGRDNAGPGQGQTGLAG